MRIKDTVNPQILVEQYGFIEEHFRWYGEQKTSYNYIKKDENRRVPSLKILYAENGSNYIAFSHPSNYYWDAIPDILLQLIQDGLVEGSNLIRITEEQEGQ